MPVSLSGLSFLHPVALWAMAAVIIPVLIHLFNRSRGRLVKIGHIDLIRNARKLKVAELKLADWLLLMLRVGLFALAALILAGLALPGLSSSNKATAYVSRAWLVSAQPNEVSDLLKRYSDSKTSQIFLLRDDFPRLDAELAKQLRKDHRQTQIINIWPSLSERLSLEKHRGEVEVYAVDNLAQFGASRPVLPQAVFWQLNHYRLTNNPITNPLTVVVAFEPQRRPDAEVLSAAFASLKAHRLPGLSWQLIDIDDFSASNMDTDWLVLLSDSVVSTDFPETTALPKVKLTDAFGESRLQPAQLLQLPFYPFSKFRVSRTGDGANMQARPDQLALLSSAENRPILQQSQLGSTRQMHFNSRFNAEWSSIALQPEFPELLLQLMMGDARQEMAFPDASVLSSQLRSPVSIDAVDTPLPRHTLQSLLAAIMVLLWLAERWLSERKRHAPN